MAEYNLWCILGKHVCYHWEIFCLYLKCWEGNRLILAIESECSCVYVSLSQRHSHYSLNTNTWKLMAITNKSGKRRERLWKGCLLKESSVQLPAKHFLGGWLDTFFFFVADPAAWAPWDQSGKNPAVVQFLERWRREQVVLEEAWHSEYVRLLKIGKELK